MKTYSICNVHNTADLEQQFAVLKEQLYQERIKQIETHVAELKEGVSQEFLEPLKAITEIMNKRIEVADILRQFRMDNVLHKFDAEVQGSHQNFEVSASNANSRFSYRQQSKI